MQQQINKERPFSFFFFFVMFSDGWMRVMLTESLVVVFRITCQSEQCGSHLLTALVQILVTQNNPL